MIRIRPRKERSSARVAWSRRIIFSNEPQWDARSAIVGAARATRKRATRVRTAYLTPSSSSRAPLLMFEPEFRSRCRLAARAKASVTTTSGGGRLQQLTCMRNSRFYRYDRRLGMHVGCTQVGTLSLRLHHHTALSLSLSAAGASPPARRDFSRWQQQQTLRRPRPFYRSSHPVCVCARVRRLLLVFCSSLSLSRTRKRRRPREANIFILRRASLSNKAQKQ